MNFVYAVFICVNGSCHITGGSPGYSAPGVYSPPQPPPFYTSLEECVRAKPPAAHGMDYVCFKKPDWTDAEADAREEQELAKPGPEAPSHE